MRYELSQFERPEIEAAAERIAGIAQRTPLVRLPHDGEAEIWLKLENLQPIRSFKIRGAANAMLAADPATLADGVWAASAGNMAQGVGYCARELDLPCTVVVPEGAPEAKIAAIRAKNAALEKRHQEVEADRLRAEVTKSAVSKATPAAKEDGDDDFRSSNMRSTQPGNRRRSGHGAGGGGNDERRSGGNAPAHQRLGEKHAPPPDPSYRFLADRMRDGDSDGDGGDDNSSNYGGRDRDGDGRRRRRQSGGGGRGRRNHSRGRGQNAGGQGQRQRGGGNQRPNGRGGGRNDENVSPRRPHKMGSRAGSRYSSQDWSGQGQSQPQSGEDQQRAIASVLKELRRGSEDASSDQGHQRSQHQKFSQHDDRDRDRNPPRSSVQDRLNRARNLPNLPGRPQQQHQDYAYRNGTIPDDPQPEDVGPWKCPDPGCGNFNSAGVISCPVCHIDWKSAEGVKLGKGETICALILYYAQV